MGSCMSLLLAIDLAFCHTLLAYFIVQVDKLLHWIYSCDTTNSR